jgi:hypothetical protein
VKTFLLCYLSYVASSAAIILIRLAFGEYPIKTTTSRPIDVFALIIRLTLCGGLVWLIWGGAS